MHPIDFTRIPRLLRNAPRLIVQRMWTELNAHTDRYRAPRGAGSFDADGLFAATEAPSLDALWTRLSERLYAVPIRSISEADYEWLCPDDGQRIFRAAEEAIAHRVDLVGTGPIEMGTPIDWHTDFKTGRLFPAAFDINDTKLGCSGEMKVPGEISRLQWLIPVGQAYLLTGDERYAVAAREVLEDWIAGNPHAQSVNWASTMEAAMRIFTWTWFFHVFCRSRAWIDQGFRARFTHMLFLHGEFPERHNEGSHITGDHFTNTAEAAGLVFAGLFFGRGHAPARWAEEGWQMLCDELSRQEFSDGVNFEASSACHPLVLELFFLAARYREACGLSVPDDYRTRVIAMARFSFAHSRHVGTTQLLGAADNARMLPFGGQATADHRYLAGLVGAHWHVTDLLEGFAGPTAEIFWALGSRAAALVDARRQSPAHSTKSLLM